MKTNEYCTPSSGNSKKISQTPSPLGQVKGLHYGVI